MGGVKKNDLPDVLRVPRPGERKPGKKTKATRTELAGWVRNRRNGGG